MSGFHSQSNNPAGSQDMLLSNFGLLALLLIGVLVGSWWLFGAHILYASLWLSYYIFKFYDGLNSWVPFMTGTEAAEIRGAIRAIPGMVPTDETFGTFTRLAGLHGYFQRWLLIPLFALSIRSARKSAVRFRYRRAIRNVYDLIDVQAHRFVSSALVKDAFILREHPHIGPYATYDLPMDIALENGMLWASREQVDSGEAVDRTTMVRLPGFTPDEKLSLNRMQDRRKRLPHHDYVLFDQKAAYDYFSGQLGPKWEGWETLPPFEKAFYAICCLQAHSKHKAAQKLIDQIGMSFKMGEYDKKTGKMLTPSTADFSGLDAVLREHADLPALAKIRTDHYHRYSVLIKTLEECRRKGRLMHSNVLWMKWVNRTLWYGIAGQGGLCPYWEAAGIWAHMQFEVIAKRPLQNPHVASAVLAMEDRMRLEHWIDPGVYSATAQQERVRQASRDLDAARGGKKGEAAAPQERGRKSSFITDTLGGEVRKRSGGINTRQRIGADDEP